MIIDAHAHLGYDTVFDEEATEEELLKYYDQYGVQGAVIQPFLPRPYLQDTRKIHDRINRLCQKYPERFRGMASINPHFRPEDYFAEASRCVKELGFVGLKITPIGHATHPASLDGRNAFAVARELEVPVMVHTGAGIPFADPVSLEGVVKDFSDCRVVLAHAGSDLFFQQALNLARDNENVYLEPSWLSIINIRKILETIGVGKVMFSSDHAVNVPVELCKYRTLIKNEDKLARVLSGTVTEVFQLDLQNFQGKRQNLPGKN